MRTALLVQRVLETVDPATAILAASRIDRRCPMVRAFVRQVRAYRDARTTNPDSDLSEFPTPASIVEQEVDRIARQVALCLSMLPPQQAYALELQFYSSVRRRLEEIDEAARLMLG